MHTFLVKLHVHHWIREELAHGLLAHVMRMLLFIATIVLDFLLRITILLLSIVLLIITHR